MNILYALFVDPWVQMGQAPDLLESFGRVGAEPVGSTPEQFVERIRSDATRWSEVIRKAGVKVQ